ncbi:hypothetical protein ACI2LF_11905 [Kribbella sp. NPDC020789]
MSWDNEAESALGAEIHAEIETYYANGTWCTRRCDTAEPFASGDSRSRMIAIGVEVARWNGLCHVIRNIDGSVAEINRYITGPYPARSPAVSLIRTSSGTKGRHL